MSEKRYEFWFWIHPGIPLLLSFTVELETREHRLMLPWSCPWNDILGMVRQRVSRDGGSVSLTRSAPPNSTKSTSGRVAPPPTEENNRP